MPEVTEHLSDPRTMHSISIDPEHLLYAKHFGDHSQAIPNSLGLDKPNNMKTNHLAPKLPSNRGRL